MAEPWCVKHESTATMKVPVREDMQRVCFINYYGHEPWRRSADIPCYFCLDLLLGKDISLNLYSVAMVRVSRTRIDNDFGKWDTQQGGFIYCCGH
jgi:hypothetical protein